MPVAALALHEFPAIHHRHHQVEQNQVGTRTFGELCQRFAPVWRLDDVVARRRQQFDQGGAYGIVILDDENQGLTRVSGGLSHGCEPTVGGRA